MFQPNLVAIRTWSQRLKRFAYHDLVGKRAVGLGPVKELNTALDRDHLGPVLSSPLLPSLRFNIMEQILSNDHPSK
jgi:hypothetical protein